jgi:hypothetical protein
MGRFSLVACYFPSFADVRDRETGCDFLDLGDGVDLSPSHVTRGGFCRMTSTAVKPQCGYVCGLVNAVKNYVDKALVLENRRGIME